MLGKPLTLAALLFIGFVSASRGADEPLHMVVDDAWSGATGIHFSGRLTEVRTAPENRHGRFRTFYRTSRLLITSGEEGTVSWRVGGHEWSLRTDDDGYWHLSTNVPPPLAPGWHGIESTPAASSPAGVLVVDPRNRLGIISDIDDTLVVSHVVETRALLKNSLTVPASRRDAVPGMASLYQRLLATNPAPESAALFYVSSSPRQLTDNIRGFLNLNAFPRGVLRLKELSEASENSLFEQQDYKLRSLETVLRSYPEMRFALFGDDGEHDPEIYAELQKKFPGQIAGVWIRRVHPDSKRARFPDQADTATLLASPDPVTKIK